MYILNFLDKFLHESVYLAPELLCFLFECSQQFIPLNHLLLDIFYELVDRIGRLVLHLSIWSTFLAESVGPENANPWALRPPMIRVSFLVD